MTANAPVDVSLAANTGTLPSAAVPAPPGWPWRRAALFLAGVSLLSHPPCLEAGRTVMAGHGRWDVEQAGLPEEAELRVTGGGQYCGPLMMKPGPGSGPWLRAGLVAVSLADQVGRAFSADEAARSVR